MLNGLLGISAILSNVLMMTKLEIDECLLYLLRDNLDVSRKVYIKYD